VRLTLRRPTGRTVCQALFARSPAKLWHLRPDSLALMLSLANVRAGARVLVVEATQGLVACAALERVGATAGAVCAATTAGLSRMAPIDCTRLFNFSTAQLALLCTATVGDLRAAAALDAPAPENGGVASAEQGRPESAAAAAGDDAAAAAKDECEAAGDDGGDGGGGEGQDGAGTSGGGKQQRPRQRPGGFRASSGLLHALTHPGFDSVLLVAPRLEAQALLRAVFPLLAPSAAFALFSPWAQPLAEAHAALQAGKQAVALSLGESWMRPHQVLPGRTHPMMNMDGTGGYVLSGVRVSADAPPAAAAAGAGGGGQAAARGAKRPAPATAAATPAAAAAAPGDDGGAAKRPKAEEAAPGDAPMADAAACGGAAQ